MTGSIVVGTGAAAADAALPRRTRSSTRSRFRVATSVVFTLVVLGATWWFVAPQQLGGSTAFVVVDGTSMLPYLHRSDLVVLRQTSKPRVADVVGYRSALLDRVVLHRIVAVNGDQYAFKGDNNAFVDAEQVGRSQLIGTVWFHVPSAGRAIGVLHVPWVLAALAALFVLVVGLEGSGVRSRERGAVPR